MENGYRLSFQRGATDEVGPGTERDMDITDFKFVDISADSKTSSS